MSLELRTRIYAELCRLPLIDPHTHINPHQPAARTLADILGYHYYTELAHSAGLPREQIEEDGLSPKELVGRLMDCVESIENTVQYSWLSEMATELFGFSDPYITADNWELFFDQAAAQQSISRLTIGGPHDTLTRGVTLVFNRVIFKTLLCLNTTTARLASR